MKQHMSEDILIKYILGEASESEWHGVESWIAASNANAKKFEDVKTILETSRRLAQVSPLSEDEAWDKFKVKLAENERKPAQIRSINSYTNWLRVAAAAVLLVGAGWISYYLYQRSGMSSQLISFSTTNNIRVDTLPDGSIVHLNKHSAISYVGNFKSQRIVKLTGEAFFEVKHNQYVPFTVNVNDITVKDIGTAFNIKSKEQSTQVIVESGIVQVSKSSNWVRLNASEMVNIKHGDQQFKVEKSTDTLYGYYRSNVFKANDVPLWRLVEILNEAYDADIKIDNNALRNTSITVTIRLQDSLENIMELIKSTTPEMRIEQMGQGIVIK